MSITEVIKYVCKDGSEWTTRQKATEHNAAIERVEAVVAHLKPRPGSSYEGYVQQDSAVVESVRKDLYNIALDGPIAFVLDTHPRDKILADAHPSYIGRMLDCSCHPVERAISRLCCIDKYGREWEQMYFAINPGKGKMVEVRA